MLTPEVVGVKKSTRCAVALLLADLACRELRHLKCAPTRPSPDKYTGAQGHSQPHHGPLRGYPRLTTGGPVKCLNRPRKAPPTVHILLIKFWGLGPIRGGSSIPHFVSLTRFFYERFLRKISRPSIQERGLYGTRPGVRESGAENPTERDEPGRRGRARFLPPFPEGGWPRLAGMHNALAPPVRE